MGLENQGRPIVFDGCAGWLHPGAAGVGVVFASPWGFEALCLRRTWRMLADQLSAAGFPTLRFDYPGTEDSLGEVDGLEPLVAATVRAADVLRERTGVKRVLILGQGLGAAVATLAAPRAQAEGLVLLAPVGRGRDHLRELSVWGAMVAETMGFSPRPGSVAGFDMPQALAEAIGALDLTKLDSAPAGKVLIATRPGRAGDAKLTAAVRALGAEVNEVTYDGYEAALGNPTSARAPVDLIEAVRDWAVASFGPGEAPGVTPAPLEPALLEGPGFTEELVRFGRDGELAGVLCEPQGQRTGATVLMLSAGGDPHSGWARTNVDHARALARVGVASMRVDSADVGDGAGPLSNEPPKLYHDGPVLDALTAVEWLESRGFGPVLLVGRCSGAFSAFNAAVRDPRIRDLVLVNERRFVWDRDGKVELATDQVGHYQAAAKDPGKLVARVLKGDVNIPAVAIKLGRAALTKALGGAAGHRRKLETAMKRAFTTLRDRGVRTTLLYSRGGEAHHDFEGYFGEDGAKLRRFADIDLQYLEDADHGLTPQHARDGLLALVTDRALWPPSAVAAHDPAAGREDLARGRVLPLGAAAAH